VNGGPPDFVGLGAQKCGTSWWFGLILEHPATAPGSLGLKELNFFSRYWDRPFTDHDRDAYHRHFPRRPGVIAGEWTPEYLLDPWAIACLGRCAADAKLLVLLRDPVDRFRSGLTHVAASGRPPTLEDARVAFQRGCYLRALTNVLSYYPRERLLLLQYERCVADPQGELRRTYEFLGLDHHRVPMSRVRRPVNATEIPLLDLDGAALERLGDAYRPEVGALAAEFPELDVNLWPHVGG
jgi:hypothetical protein